MALSWRPAATAMVFLERPSRGCQSERRSWMRRRIGAGEDDGVTEVTVLLFVVTPPQVSAFHVMMEPMMHRAYHRDC